MIQFLLNILFFPLDLVYLTLDACIISWRSVMRLFKRKKLQRCHLCHGESNQEADHPVRAVLKYQNKWMVKFLAPCIRIRKEGKRRMGFCQKEGYMTKPPAWVPLLALGLLAFWLGGGYFILWLFSSDRDNMAQNFVSTIAPSTMDEKEDGPNILGEASSQLNPERAERFFLSGVKHFDKTEYADAVVDFKIAIQNNPGEANYHYYLARAYRAIGQTVKSESSLKDTLLRNPDHEEALILMAQYLQEQEEAAEAEKLAARALELNPENVTAIRMNAALRAMRGEKESTRQLMDQLYALDSKNPDTLTFLGKLELSLFQDLEAARTRLESALAQQENFIPAMLEMINIYANENNLAKVDETLNQILEINPDYLPALLFQANLTMNRFGPSAGLRAYGDLMNRFGGNLDVRLRYTELLIRSGKLSLGKKYALQLASSGVRKYDRAAEWLLAQMYAQIRMHEEAVNHAQRAMRLSPNKQNLHIFLAEQYIALEDYREARRQAEGAYNTNRQDMRAINILTDIMVRQKELDAAIELLDGLLAEFPDSDPLRKRRVDILMKSPRWMEAMEDTHLLYEKYPENDSFKNNRAFMMARSGQSLEEADVMSRELVEKFPENPIIQDTRAFVLAAQGQHEEALEIYEQALKRVPENSEIRYHYVKSLLAVGRKDEASKHLYALLMINPNFPQFEEARELLSALQGEEG